MSSYSVNLNENTVLIFELELCMGFFSQRFTSIYLLFLLLLTAFTNCPIQTLIPMSYQCTLPVDPTDSFEDKVFTCIFYEIKVVCLRHGRLDSDSVPLALKYFLKNPVVPEEAPLGRDRNYNLAKRCTSHLCLLNDILICI